MSANHLATLFSEHRGKVSDKWAIYIAEYERLFAPYAHQAINLLEIGIQNGGSLEIWAKYFTQATHIIGCDINPACQQLTFNDERIHVVVINANTDEAEQKIKSHATNFDLIIDDGSHQSGDIVCSFERYFSLVKSGGLYIAEDLHCSYWQDFQGGLYQPYSSIEFFKHLADIVNYEHWGVEKTRSELLTNFNQQYQSAIDEHSLAEIHSVEFVNSLCIVRKLNASANSLGLRVVSGETALVCADVLPLNGSPISQPNQQHNNWAQHSALALEKADHRQDNENSTQQWQALKTQLTDEQQRYQHLKETNQQQINALQAELNEQLKAQLQREQAYQNHTNALLTQRNDEIKTLEHTYFEQRQQTQKAQAEHEWLTSERIHTLSERLQTTQTELAQRDKQLAAQAYEFTNTLVEAKKHIELLLAEKNEGSEAVAHQYAELTAHYEQAKANLTAHYQAQLTTLQAQHAEHEWLANERMHILQERLHAAQTHTQERETVHAEREHTTANQLQALQNQLNTAFAQYVKAEATHTQLIEQTKQQAAHEANTQSAQHTAHLDELKQTLANQRQKEQDRAQQHHTQIQQLVAEHTNAEQMHQAQVAALHREMETRQQEQLNQQAEYKAQLEAQHRALVAQANEQINELTLSHTAQVQALQSQLNAAQLVFKEQEQSLAAQMHASQQQAEADIRALRQQHQTQLEAMQQQHAAQERHLKAQCQAKQDELTQLGQRWLEAQQAYMQSVSQLEQQLQTMRTSYTWRWTAPLRSFSKLFIKADASLQEDLHDNNDRVPHTPRLMQDGTVTNRLQSSPQVDIHEQFITTNSAPISGSNMSANRTPRIAQSVSELLSYYDEEFVYCAYQTLLDRAPDEDGLRYYLARVRAGISKIEILTQLRLSREGKVHPERLLGIDAAIQINRRKQWPVIGSLFTNIAREQRIKLNSIENKIYHMEAVSTQRFNYLYNSVGNLRNDIAALSKQRCNVEMTEQFYQKQPNQESVTMSHDYQIVSQSGLFDPDFYLKTYPDIASSTIDPLEHYLSNGWREGRNPSSMFDTNFYISQYNDIKESGNNPLLHFIKYGNEEGRNVLAKNTINDLDKTFGLLTNKTNLINTFKSSKPIDIIIPVYNGYEHLEALFNSIVKNSTMPYRLIIINDCSPDQRVGEYLLEFRVANSTIDIVFIQNEYNLGFIKSVNKGILYIHNHFVLLNTDVEVPPGWLERLMYPIFKMDGIASTTPFTNSGTICSFPNYLEDNDIFENLSVEDIDQYFQYVNAELTNIEIPTGVGFCMGVNKELVDKIGMFDEIFGKGYGEENDWCQRAIKEGYKNLHVTNLFVYHKHGGSFPSEEKARLIEVNSKILTTKNPTYFAQVAKFINKDELQSLRDILKIRMLSDKYKATLILDHSLGGGANEYTQEKIINEQLVAVIAYDPLNNNYLITFGGNKLDKQKAFEFSEIKTITLLTDFLKIKKVIINNLVSYPNVFDLLADIESALLKHPEIKLDILIHDHYYVCPMYNLLNYEMKFCGVPDDLKICNQCLKTNHLITSQVGYIKNDYPSLNIELWRLKFGKLLNKADNIIAFSNSTKQIFQKAFPALQKNAVEVMPHIVDWVRPVNISKCKSTLNVAIIGNMSLHKGLRVIADMVAYADSKSLPIKFHFFGDIPKGLVDIEVFDCFTKHGRYKKNNLPELMERNQIELVFVPSIWPETFSYTTEEAIKMKIAVAVFNLGAPAERVQLYDKGIVLNNFNIDEILDIFLSKFRKDYSKVMPKNKNNSSFRQELFIHQIYYDENQKKILSNKFIPYYNPISDESKTWHESEVFFREYISGNITENGLHGYLSWRFSEKTLISEESFIDFIDENPDYDVYFINPFPELADLYSNVWEQGEIYHAGIKNLAESLFKKIGYDFDLDSMRNDKTTLLYCNYWVGNKKFWDAYMNFLLPIYNQLKEMSKEELSTYTADAGYHTGVGYITFLMERLFSTFLSQSTDLKYKPYIYDKIQIAQLISNLRKQVGM